MLALVLALGVHAIVLGWPVPGTEEPGAPSAVAVSLVPRLPASPEPSGVPFLDSADHVEPSPVPPPPLEPSSGRSERPPVDAQIDAEGPQAQPQVQEISFGDEVGGPQVGFDYDAWAIQVRQRVDAHKVYPYAARSRGLEGRVTVGFSVSGQGDLVGEPRVTSSGWAVLDRAAVAAVVAAAPFASPPSGTVEHLELTLVFTLR